MAGLSDLFGRLSRSGSFLCDWWWYFAWPPTLIIIHLTINIICLMVGVPQLHGVDLFQSHHRPRGVGVGAAVAGFKSGCGLRDGRHT